MNGIRIEGNKVGFDIYNGERTLHTDEIVEIIVLFGDCEEDKRPQSQGFKGRTMNYKLLVALIDKEGTYKQLYKQYASWRLPAVKEFKLWANKDGTVTVFSDSNFVTPNSKQVWQLVQSLYEPDQLLVRDVISEE